MKEYFCLQYKMLNRKLAGAGLHPAVGCLLLLSVFVGLSVYLFYLTGFAPSIYLFVALFFTARLSATGRSDFLRHCFGDARYRKIRLLENQTAVLPFVVFLICRQQFLPALALAAAAALMSLLRFKTGYSLTIPTPFYKKPFEFTVGFRNTFLIFPLAYGLTAIAAVVDNFNLSVFSLALIFLTAMSYYLKPENEYFVWMYSLTPAQFLWRKIKTALFYSSCLCLPVLVLPAVFFPQHTIVLLLFTLAGYLYLTTVILAKYAAYPNEMGMVQAIIICIAFVFPPILVAVIPFFAVASVNRLKVFLR